MTLTAGIHPDVATEDTEALDVTELGLKPRHQLNTSTLTQACRAIEDRLEEKCAQISPATTAEEMKDFLLVRRWLLGRLDALLELRKAIIDTADETVLLWFRDNVDLARRLDVGDETYWPERKKTIAAKDKKPDRALLAMIWTNMIEGGNVPDGAESHLKAQVQGLAEWLAPQLSKNAVSPGGFRKRYGEELFAELYDVIYPDKLLNGEPPLKLGKGEKRFFKRSTDF